MTNAIQQRYRAHADAFERTLAGVRPDQWSDPSPCADWSARDVVGHVIDMHGVMLRPLDRQLSPAASLQDDPLAAFRAARADVEALLEDPELAAIEHDTPGGRMSVEAHIDRVVSEDLVLHGWDLARATGQDDTIDPADVERMWPSAQAIGVEMRTPGFFGPGIVVYGPEVPVAADAPLQDRLLGLIGRDPHWTTRSSA